MVGHVTDDIFLVFFGDSLRLLLVLTWSVEAVLAGGYRKSLRGPLRSRVLVL